MPIEAARNWINELLNRHGLRHPDKRPLYAYRCTADDLETLSARTSAILRATVHLDRPHQLAGALFCLFTAEWIRRHYTGGKLRYEDILGALHPPFPKPAYRVLRGWVTVGMNFWVRPLLQTNQRRIFLLTLACEGGLPLQFLQKDGAALSRYFRVLLANLQTYENANISAETLAAEAAQQYLPQYLRQDIVYPLSAQIALAVRDLRQQVAGAADPIATLDAQHSNWRDQFPLDLGDQNALGFLAGLIKPPPEPPQGQPKAAVAVNRSLLSLPGATETWQLQAEIELTGSVPVEHAVAAFGGEPAGRLQLLLQVGQSAASPLAWATRSGPRVRLERARAVPRYFGAGAVKAFQLTTRPQLADQPSVTGGEALEDLPWVFISNDESDTSLSFRGQGSIKTRHETVWIAVPADWTLVADGYAEITAVGTLDELERPLFRIAGQVRVQSHDGSHCRIQTGAERPDETVYHLLGPRVYNVEAPIPQYLGLPTVRQIAQGNNQQIPPAQLRWRPRNGAGGWRQLTNQCYGDGELRVIDPDGVVRFRTRLGILPAGFQVSYAPPLTVRGGRLQFAVAAAAVGVLDPPEGVTWEQVNVAANAEAAIDLACGDQPPQSVSIMLRWAEGAESRLTLPFPALGARFIDSTGQILPDRAIVIRDRLSGVRVRVISPVLAAHYWLTGKLHADYLTPEVAQAAWLRVPIPAVAGTNGHVRELDLLQLRDDLMTMLAASMRLDAEVILRVWSLGGGFTPSIRIKRYDLKLEQVPDQRPDQLAIQFAAELDQATLARMNLSMFPLWMPETDPLPLHPVLTGVELTGQWRIDRADLAVGPWMIAAREGDWNRTRPLDVRIEDADLQPEDPEANDAPDLATVLRIQDDQKRKEALKQIVTHLRNDPFLPDWEMVLGLIEVFSDLPASALDLFPILADDPEAVVMALLREDAVDVPDLLALFEQLPFSWHMVPIQTWLRAIRRHRDSLMAALDQLSNPTELVWGSIEAILQTMEERYPYVRVIRELAYREIYSELPRGQNVILDKATTPNGILSLHRQLMQAHQLLIRGKDHWPEGNALMRWIAPEIQHREEVRVLLPPTPDGVGYRRPVQNAPIAAAMASAYGLEPSARVVFEIARLRIFDRQWFDDAYRLALTWMIVLLMAKNPNHWE